MGERFEAALPDVAAGAVTSQTTTDVRREQPVHPTAQVAIIPRREGEVEMIGLEAVGQDSHRDANRRLGHDLDEGVIVVGFVESGRASISAIEDMVGVSADGTASGTRRRSPECGGSEVISSHSSLPILRWQLAMSPFTRSSA
jgi:hypothetical protein